MTNFSCQSRKLIFLQSGVKNKKNWKSGFPGSSLEPNVGAAWSTNLYYYITMTLIESQETLVSSKNNISVELIRSGVFGTFLAARIRSGKSFRIRMRPFNTGWVILYNIMQDLKKIIFFSRHILGPEFGFRTLWKVGSGPKINHSGHTTLFSIV